MEIYVPADQRTALAAIDVRELGELLDQAIWQERSENLWRLNLPACGPHVAMRYNTFEQALTDYRTAKSPRKRAETGDYLQKTKRDLLFGIESMKRRVEKEKEDEQRFHVQGQFAPPYRFNQRLSATVSYRWRLSVGDEWTHGSITFIHDVDLTPDYSLPRPKRKLSAAKQQREVQKELSDTWDSLMSRALYSVREFFKNGGKAADVPETFQVKVDEYGDLNNYSTDFWRKNK